MSTTERQNKRHSRRSGGPKTGKRRCEPWNTDEILETMRERRKWKNIITPIEKKVGAEECSDYKTLSLISHPSKI